MPRPLRIDQAGGLYHVLNRGNYKEWIFETEGAKEAFERTLFEACERAGWVLHAYCIMSNHYHLALETPDGNLSEGMRWLQSVFAARFNRFRKESGHLFQGRFKSLAVEDEDHLSWLCHYIHLNPLRAGLCTAARLAEYRWSSLWYLDQPRNRPAALRVDVALRGAGNLRDRPADRRSYLDYLRWLQTDEPARKDMLFEKMSKGWVIGGAEFRQQVAGQAESRRAIAELSYQEAKEARAEVWEATLVKCMRVLRKKETQIATTPKAADWKVGIAALLKQRKMAPNGWLARRLGMGHESGVSRYVVEALRGDREEALATYQRLDAKVKD
ncbi:transposase [Actomonas aquatica]|uniref:Transposase n=1 Tax=Actomonas aquatica TaxID=2866162 RepID=A0ABZ1CEU8_9BACT|nr:transposase [Opitutus sp. WL0086]WRQ89971.1 transposase [Opitutus sp. WL0086]